MSKNCPVSRTSGRGIWFPLRLEDMKVPDVKLWGASHEQILPSTWNWKTGLSAALTGVQLGQLGAPRPSVKVCPEEPSPWGSSKRPQGVKLPFAASGRSASDGKPGSLVCATSAPELSTTERGPHCLTTENQSARSAGGGLQPFYLLCCALFSGEACVQMRFRG